MANKNILGFNLSGSDTYYSRPYGTCSTAAATAAKAVTWAGFILTTGATILVKFSNANSASSPTLNVNSTGAKTIIYHNAALTSSLYYWSAGDVCEFVYDGTYWVLMNVGNTDTDTWRGITDSVSTTSSSICASATAVKTAYDKANHSHPYLPTAGGTMTGTITMNIGTGIQMKYDRATDGNPWMYANGADTYGIRYFEGDPDKMVFSASGNAKTPAAADLCINGNGEGTVTIRGNSIWHIGNLTKVSQLTNDSGYLTALPSHSHTYIKDKDNYSFTSSTLPTSFDQGISCGFVQSDNAAFPSFGSVLTCRTYSGGGGTLQLYAPYSSTYGGTRLRARFGNYAVSNGNSWTAMKEIAWLEDIPTNTNQLTNGAGYITGITKTMVINALGYTPPTTNSTYNFSGVSFSSGNSGTAEHNCNSITSNGHWYYTSNGPSGLGEQSTDGALYSQAYNDSWVGQIAQDYRNGNLFTRGRNNGSWTAWKAVSYNGHTHNYAAAGHTHDDRYYTESEVNSKLATYVPLAGGTMTGPLFNSTTKTGTNLASYVSTASTVTGTIKITLPSGWSSTMGMYEIWVYEYNGVLAGSKILVGGYNYGSGGWHNYTYSTQGTYTRGVRLAHDGSKNCILLGTTSSSWAYPQIYLKEVASGFSGADYMVKTGYSISVITSESSINSIVSAGRSHEYASAFYQDSDERLKTFYDPINIDLDKLKALRKNYFKFNDKDEMQLGVSAQEVQKLYPELVSSSPEGYLSVAYDKLSVVALAAVDKLTDKIETLEDENKLLKERLDKIEKMLNI